MMKHYEEFWCK